MWVPYRPNATEAERAILRFLAPLLALLVVFALAWESCSEFKLERKAQRDARSACVASGLSEPECKLKVLERGDECWERHYFTGSRGVSPNLNEAGYRACILQAEPGSAPAPVPLP